MGSALEKLALIAKERKDWAPLQPFLAQIQDLLIEPDCPVRIGLRIPSIRRAREGATSLRGGAENSEWYSRARYARAVALIALKRQSEAREEQRPLEQRNSY